MKKSSMCLRGSMLFVSVFLFTLGMLGVFFTDDAAAQTRPALVRDVDNGARQPFSASNSIVNFDTGNVSMTQTLLAVPAGKRAVVEHVSCINYLEAGNNFVRFEMQYTASGGPARHQFVNTRVGTSFVGSIDVWSFSQPVQAYADPSTPISINALRRSTTGSGGIECYISGYYVDFP